MPRRRTDIGRGSTTSAAFGPVLRQLRIAAGQTQAGFSQAAAIDRTFISQLERGIRQPSLAVFIVIARALGIAPTRLMSLTVKELKEQRRRIS